MVKQAIIYARVSTSVQSTDRQVIDLQAYAQGNGCEVMHVFTEQISGARRNDEREQLTSAVEFAEQNGCTILCSELSRLGRNIDEVLKMIIHCKEHGINIFFQKEQFSIFNQDGQPHPFLMIFIATLGTCASMEREAIRFRMKSGYDKFRAEGGKVGRKTGFRFSLADYEAKYPDLVSDLRKKIDKNLRGDKYSVRYLASEHNVNASTVQVISNMMKGGAV